MAAFHRWQQWDRLCCSRKGISAWRLPRVLGEFRGRKKEGETWLVESLTWTRGQGSPARGREGWPSRGWSFENSSSRRWWGISASRSRPALIKSQLNNQPMVYCLANRASESSSSPFYFSTCSKEPGTPVQGISKPGSRSPRSSIHAHRPSRGSLAGRCPPVLSNTQQVPRKPSLLFFPKEKKTKVFQKIPTIVPSSRLFVAWCAHIICDINENTFRTYEPVPGILGRGREAVNRLSIPWRAR